MTMKECVIFLLMAIVAACSSPKPQTMAPSEDTNLDLFIGTYTSGDSEGIYKVSFNPSTGVLSEKELIAKTENPSYLALAQGGKQLYAVNENEPGTLSFFEKASDTYTLEAQVSTQGVHPCHVTVDEALGLISVSNYSSGTLSLFHFKDSLVLKETYTREGAGPNKERQDGPHAHFSALSPNKQFIYGTDLGIDQVYAHLAANPDSSFVAWQAIPGDGPRHLDFHPDKPWVFVLNELSNNINSFRLNNDGTFSEIDRKSTLPEEYSDFSKAADIHVSPDGKYLFASNRGFDSIVAYEILDDGKLKRISFTTEGIKTPRNFVIDPAGNFLLVANQDGNDIAVFRITETGTLQPTGNRMEVGSPVCMVFP